VRFLLVDRIVALESGRSATGIKNVTLSEDFFTHHFPGAPIMPGALITECLVQLADWVLREGSNFEQVALPATLDRMKFHRLVRPGDQLRLDVEILGVEEQRARVRARASCGDKPVAAGQFTLALTPAGPLIAAEESRRAFEMIRAD
jgi:3-hydroxyacyl-[acyl-carrier-protein] dehydratase